MTDTTDISLIASAERFDSGERMPVDKVELGQWYWIKDWHTLSQPDRGIKKGQEYTWFGCVMKIGSNFVELHSVKKDHSYESERVHFDQFEERLRYEPNPDVIIQENIDRFRRETQLLLGEVTELTKRLGVVPTKSIQDQTGDSTNALIAVTEQVDTAAYKNALIEAKEKTLPELFKAIEKANANMASWMIAPTMAISASISPMKKTIKGVEDRIHTLELYAGLTEEALQVRGGEPAARYEPLRLMQRRMYMDEECLANYEAGGMEIRDIEQFDEWLARPENFTRILPFQRCATAFRVRRNEKERESETISDIFINIFLRNADKTTFLYVRNGDQLWRINTSLSFGEKIIPDREEFDPSQPMMVKLFAGSVDKIIPKSAWEVMKAEGQEKVRLYHQWKKDNPGDNMRNPHGFLGPDHQEWKDYHPFSPTSVYYDEASEVISDAIKQYNRIAVIIQGLFDRSMVLHPHDPVKVWDPASFAANVELIYDSMTLTYGDKPDFEAFRAKLNASFKVGSMSVGQDDVWARREAAKENARQRADHRYRNPSNYIKYRPHNNPGPGRVAPITDLTKTGKATFRWTRPRGDNTWNARNQTVNEALQTSISNLLNVDAYQPGDFKQFFADPRTRREYIKWAPLLLTAEDYLAGKLKRVILRDERAY